MSNRRHGGRPERGRQGAGGAPGAERVSESASGPLLSPRGIEAAHEAVIDVAGAENVGEHLGGIATSPETAVHRFACQERGYPGWEWVAVIARAPGAGYITVNEVALHAGDHALSAPAWVPYEDRVRPGDLHPGDHLPLKHDDPRIIDTEDLLDDEGVRRNAASSLTLSDTGLDAALRRWISGKNGPDSEFAREADDTCSTCAFWLPLQRKQSEVGVCANEYSADGQIVAADYGCGAHSDTPRDDGEGIAARTPWDDGGPERF